MSILNSFIEQQLEAASKDGAFDNLSGAGKPIDTSRDPLVDMAQKAAKEGGIKPPVVVLREKIKEAAQTLSGLDDPDARKVQMKILADLQTRLAIETERFSR